MLIQLVLMAPPCREGAGTALAPLGYLQVSCKCSCYLAACLRDGSDLHMQTCVRQLWTKV